MAGWGELRGPDLRGLRSLLSALAHLLPPRAGAGLVTVNQIAAAAGYSDRWTRDRLYLLEELELIVWKRGGILEGEPTPSHIRVHKRALVALLELAREARELEPGELAAALRSRVEKYRLRNVIRRHKPRLRRSAHVALSSYLPPPGEVPGPLEAAPGAYARGVSAARDELAAARRRRQETNDAVRR